MLYSDGYNLRIITDEELKTKEGYKKTCEEFIQSNSDDNVVIDLTGKVVVALEALDSKRLPIDIYAILIPEEERYNYKATLIYSAHIAFIKLEYKDGRVKYLIKDDECYPKTFQETIEESGDLLYIAEDNGFTADNIFDVIRMKIKVEYDYNFELKKEDLIILEGL
jgi:hypothetical protein